VTHILAARRTAVVPERGAFRALQIHDLAAPVIRAVLADAGLGVDEVDELILANALGAGGNPARLAALAAGLPDRVAGLTIDRQCAGGLDAIAMGHALIASGQARVVVAGGAESFSRRPIRLSTDPHGGPPEAYDRPPFTPFPERDPDMHRAAAALAARLGMSRAAQDAWAQTSHARALAARDRLAAEIVVLEGQTHDPFARVLTPALTARARVIQGPITTANAAVSADAAAFVVLSATPRGPRALTVEAAATRGAAPDEPGLAPLAAIRAVLETSPGPLAVAEIMEAYAVQAIACVEGAGLDPGTVNPGGGALSRGHPIGASGAILAVRLFHDLNQGRGLAAIASAGGIGSALIVSR
jgi:acetyl-CoA C-acetyltransferase